MNLSFLDDVHSDSSDDNIDPCFSSPEPPSFSPVLTDDDENPQLVDNEDYLISTNEMQLLDDTCNSKIYCCN